MTETQTTPDTSRSPEEIARMIRDFASDVNSPDNWRISIPDDSFDEIEEHLDITRDSLGTHYKGISLCYTKNYNTTQISYNASLDDWNECVLNTE